MSEELVMTADNCRHCGAARGDTQALPDGDWLCNHCEHYQDTMVCPTCNSVVRASLMPAEMVPAAAKPKRAKKEEE